LTYTVEGLRDSFGFSSAHTIFKDALILSAFLSLFVFMAINRLKKKFE